MQTTKQTFGFEYFSSPKYLVNKVLNEWMSQLRQLGASSIIFKADFNRAIPEDVFASAQKFEIMPIIHFPDELPLARKLNDVLFLLDLYAKWGCSKVILGDRPNIKSAWPISGWHYENLVDHFLDRFIPLANHAVRIGLDPVFPPLQPGGDFWDTAFIELALNGLKRRRLDEIITRLSLSSYGFTYNKPLSWGKGGPERWAGSKPYQTPEGQEDQLGFHNFEWVQALSQRVFAKQLPMIILDAGNFGTIHTQTDPAITRDYIVKIFNACHQNPFSKETDEEELITFGDSVLACHFNLDTLKTIFDGKITPAKLREFFGDSGFGKGTLNDQSGTKKVIENYLLLPSHNSGLSDAVLNKVRPLIKQAQPTVGFSLEEAALAQQVFIYPDPVSFPDDAINKLRAGGCVVKVLPESGIEIATLSMNI